MTTTHDLDAWRHGHVFDAGNAAAERGTRLVVAITVATMAVEIVAGWLTGSMALLADGFHMSTHAVAIGLSAFAYAAARRHAGDPRFAFGTWKIEVLAAFASAVLLLAVAALMLFGSIERFVHPEPIRHVEAIVVAALGLVVNAVCALILGSAHGHDHGHGHGHGHPHDAGRGADRHDHHDHHDHDGHDHDHGHDAPPPPSGATDLNLRSAYVHVLADAGTSVLAIAALAGGWLWGWDWLDPAMGVVGAGLVAVWARRLIADSAKTLLDREMDHPVVDAIRASLAAPALAASTDVSDLHVWRVGRDRYACALALVTHDPALTPADVRAALAGHDELAHVTVEINRCPPGCVRPAEPAAAAAAASPG